MKRLFSLIHSMTRRRRTDSCEEKLYYIKLHINDKHRLLIEGLSRYYECHDANTIGKAVHILALVRDVEIAGGKIDIVMRDEDGNIESVAPINIS